MYNSFMSEYFYNISLDELFLKKQLENTVKIFNKLVLKALFKKIKNAHKTK